MPYIIKFRRDTAADWTTRNPLLSEGEPGLELDTGMIKYGDGVRRWNSLPYDSTQLTPAEIDIIVDQVEQELELQDLVLLYENAKA